MHHSVCVQNSSVWFVWFSVTISVSVPYNLRFHNLCVMRVITGTQISVFISDLWRYNWRIYENKQKKKNQPKRKEIRKPRIKQSKWKICHKLTDDRRVVEGGFVELSKKQPIRWPRPSATIGGQAFGNVACRSEKSCRVSMCVVILVAKKQKKPWKSKQSVLGLIASRKGVVALCSVVHTAFSPINFRVFFPGFMLELQDLFPGYFSDVIAEFLLKFSQRFWNYFAQNFYRNYSWNFY